MLRHRNPDIYYGRLNLYVRHLHVIKRSISNFVEDYIDPLFSESPTTLPAEKKKEEPNPTLALFKAISVADIEGVNNALAQGANVYGEDSEGFFPFLRAAQIGNIPILQTLLENKADVNTVHIATNQSALYEAILQNRQEAAVFLLENGAIQDEPSYDGEMPIHACARSGSLEIIQLLITYDAIRLNDVNKKKQTPLMLAVNAKHEPLVNWLLENGARWDIVDSEGKKAVDYAKGNLLALLSRVERFDGFDSSKEAASSAPWAQMFKPPQEDGKIAKQVQGELNDLAQDVAKIKVRQIVIEQKQHIAEVNIGIVQDEIHRIPKPM
jgi:hypothetical protein